MDFLFESQSYNLDIMKAMHVMESALSIYDISVMTESEDNALNTLKEKAKSAIQKVIDAIKDFIDAVHKKLMTTFKKEDIDNLKIVSKNVDKLKDGNEQIEVFDEEKARRELDEYLQEMLKLERKITNLKFEYKLQSKKNRKDAFFIMEYESIMKEIDRLNEKYDKKLLDDNFHIIKMAKKDAVRFSEKQLDNIGVDYDQMKKGSEEILSQFKTDINGCKRKETLSCLQKLTQKSSTIVRKYIQKITTYKHRSIMGVIKRAATAAIVAEIMLYGSSKIRGSVYSSNTLKNVENGVKNFVKNNS